MSDKANDGVPTAYKIFMSSALILLGGVFVVMLSIPLATSSILEHVGIGPSIVSIATALLFMALGGLLLHGVIRGRL